MTTRQLKVALLASALIIASAPVFAQQPAQPAGQGPLPEVEVIQKQPKQAAPAKKAAAPKAAPKKKAVAAPAPAPTPPSATVTPPPPQPEVVDAPQGQTINEAGQTATNAAPVTTPVTGTTILPQDLSGYAGAASRVTDAELNEQRPRTVHEALATVPGVVTTTDDGGARHAGIGIRGSNFRRARKVLVLEDGYPDNFTTYIDSSTHYTPPTHRVESLEVLRGNIVTQGPLNNHGVVNFVNLSPFGAPETELEVAFGHEDYNHRHFHHRQQSGNFGFVFSYTGSEQDGAWDTERLRYNDFYTAFGWKGADQDLTVSAVYFRQRDNYDEANFEGSNEEFRNEIGHCKLCYAPGSQFNTYADDHTRVQIAHNYYVDPDTTVSTRLYTSYHDRPRFEQDGNILEDPDARFQARNRHYYIYGADSRVEFANLPFLMGMTQDIQTGVKFEYQRFLNRNVFGDEGVILDFSNRGGPDSEIALDEVYESAGAAGFLQSAIHVTRDFKVIPGVRLEYYNVQRDTFANEDAEPGTAFPFYEKFDYAHILPGIGFAWDGLDRTTVYGGYHRGHAPHNARGETFPLNAEIGNNYQLGVRTTAFTGLTLDAAVFHSDITHYQIKEAFTSPSGNNIFGDLDQVEFMGFEGYGRLDSSPFHGGPWNFFAEGTYTFVDAEIEDGVDIDADTGAVLARVDGNLVPQSLRHFAHLTLGVEHKSGWDVSASYTYRGSFFTDVANTQFDDDGEVGHVDDVWLLSARANYTIPGTGTTLFVSGQNLADELYITDREDGIKPGQGATYFVGIKIKFDHSRPIEP